MFETWCSYRYQGLEFFLCTYLYFFTLGFFIPPQKKV